MAAMTVVGILSNLIVILMFSKQKKTRTMILLMSLAISDGTMAAIGGTMYAINCIYHRWIFGQIGR